MKPAIEVGQRWKVGGITYRVESVTGEDGCYPIELVEVERDASINAELDAQIGALHPELRRLSYLPALRRDLRRMKQERRWFERSDVTYEGVRAK